MSLEVVIGNRLRTISKTVIGQIEISSGIEPENFIVVPDRFSLIAEKLVFEQLGINSTFNIQVIGISKLAKMILDENNVRLELLNNDQCKLLLLEILNEQKDNLENLNIGQANLALADEILKIIFQLKANNISPEKFKLQVCQNKKFEDIANLYVIYNEKINKIGIDQSDLLDKFSDYILQSKVIKNSNFFFVEFDSLTEQGGKILEGLIKAAKRVVIGALQSEKQKNAHIFDSDILFKINKICKNNKIAFTKKYINDGSISCQQKHLLQNLYGFHTDKQESKNVHLLQFDNQEQELKEIAKAILFQIKYKGKKFRDINVSLPNLHENYFELESIFEKYDIPVFIDSNISLNYLLPVKFLKSLFDFINDNSAEKFLFVLNNPYSKIEYEDFCDVQNYINKFGNFDLLNLEKEENLSKNIKIFIKSYKNIIKNVNVNDKNKNYIEFINQIINEFEFAKTTDNLIFQFKKYKEIKLEKVYQQVLNKIQTTLQAFEKVENQDNTFVQFVKTFCTLLDEKEISAVPISVDSVFAGDAAKSYFEERDVLFVCGAKEGSLPATIKDISIMSDKDIDGLEDVKNNFVINPTVKMINKRNKFKVYQDLISAKELFISYSGETLGVNLQPSNLFTELQKIFLIDGQPLLISRNFFNEIVKGEIADNFELFDIQTENDYHEKLIELIRDGKIKELEDAEYANCAEDVYTEHIKDAKDVLSHNSSISATQLEQFFECPFKHFFIKGLKLKENEICKFDGRDIGNYFHNIAEHFVRENAEKLGKLSEEEIKQILSKINNAVYSNERFARLYNNFENRHIVVKLKKEAQVLLTQINKENNYSDFVAKFLEKGFKSKIGEIFISGCIDRVDISGNDFRVIDYKSGEIKDNLAAVYKGVELQLFIYLLAIRNEFNLNPVGAFYMPVGNDFSNKGSSSKLLLEGFTLQDSAIIKKYDRRFGNGKLDSDIISLKLLGNSTADILKLSTKKNTFSQQNWNDLLKYIELLVKQGTQDMFSGNIKASPLGDSACRSCKFYGVCSFKEEEGDTPRVFGKVPTEVDLGNIDK